VDLFIEDPVTPGRDPFLLGGVIHVRLVIILVGGVEVEGAFSELAEDGVVVHVLDELVFVLQVAVLLLVDAGLHCLIIHVQPEVQVAKDELVVVPLDVMLRDRNVLTLQLLELPLVYLPDVFHSLRHLLLATSQVAVHKSECSVIKVESDRHGPFVPTLAPIPSLHLALPHVAHAVLVDVLHVNQNQTPHHDLLPKADVLFILVQ